MANVYNFFKFLEDKADRKVPLKVKLLNDPESITKEDLVVKRDLNLRGKPIKNLPDNLEIFGYLNLDDTLITSLPNNLKVGWYLSFKNTLMATKYQQYTKKELKKMFPGVKGGIYS